MPLLQKIQSGLSSIHTMSPFKKAAGITVVTTLAVCANPVAALKIGSTAASLFVFPVTLASGTKTVSSLWLNDMKRAKIFVQAALLSSATLTMGVAGVLTLNDPQFCKLPIIQKIARCLLVPAATHTFSILCGTLSYITSQRPVK